MYDGTCFCDVHEVDKMWISTGDSPRGISRMLLDIQNQSKIFCFEVKLKETHASVLDKQVELTMIPWPPSGKGSRLIFESLLFRIPGLDGQFSHIFVADNELFEKTQK